MPTLFNIYLPEPQVGPALSPKSSPKSALHKQLKFSCSPVRQILTFSPQKEPRLSKPWKKKPALLRLTGPPRAGACLIQPTIRNRRSSSTSNYMWKPQRISDRPTCCVLDDAETERFHLYSHGAGAPTPRRVHVTAPNLLCRHGRQVCAGHRHALQVPARTPLPPNSCPKRGQSFPAT